MIQDLVLTLMVFFLPTQLGLHFWPEFARVNGIKIDYYSPTLYLTDVLILVLLILNTRFIDKYLKNRLSQTAIFALLLLLNLVFSLNKFNSIFQYLRIIEYLLLYFVLSSQKNLWEKVAKPFKLSLITIIVLQIAQHIHQRSVGGLFYLLGERFFTSTTPGLARSNLVNMSITRVPSTFSHPNSLAGYLTLSLVILSKYEKTLTLKIFTLLSLVFTLSKSAYLALLAYCLKINLGNKIFVIFTLVSLLQLFSPVTHSGIYSLDSRSTMISQFLKLPPKYFLFGVGLGNYPTALSNILPGSMTTPSVLQPIHNLFLLLLVELGLPITTFLIFYLTNNYQKKYLNIIIAILVSGLFDHYWLTIPQNKLIILLSLALFK